MHLRQFMLNILTRLSHKLQIDTVFYSHIMGWVGVNYLSGLLRGIATTFFLARWLPVESFGALRYVIAIHAIAGTFSFSAFHSSIIRGIAAGDTEVAWAGATKMLKLSCLGSLVILAAALERYWRHEPLIAACLFIAAVFFPGLSAGSLYGSIMTGLGKITKLAKHNALMNMAFVGLFFTVLILSRNNLFIISLAFFGGDVLLKTWLSLYHLRRLPRRGSANQHLKLGSHLSLMGIFQAFVHQIDQLIIQRWFGYTALANYNIAILIPEQIIDFFKGFSGILLQRKTRSTQTATNDAPSVRQQILLFTLFMVTIWGLYSLAMPILLPRLFPQYANEVIPAIIYGLGMTGTASVIGISWMQAHQKIKLLWRFSIFNSLSQILTTVFLTSYFGSLGAIAAKTITRLASLPFTVPPIKNNAGEKPSIVR